MRLILVTLLLFVNVLGTVNPKNGDFTANRPEVETGIDKTGDLTEEGPTDWEEIKIPRSYMYVIYGVGVRTAPNRASKILKELPEGARVCVTAKVMNEDGRTVRFYRAESREFGTGYIASGRLITRSTLYKSPDGDYQYEKKRDGFIRYYNEELCEDGLTDRWYVGCDMAVAPIKQYPELPEGCEITSLTEVLNYFGYSANKLTMADRYLPKSDSAYADPNEYYLFNPRSNGLYCFAPVLVKTVEAYNLDNGTDICAEDITGCEVTELYGKLLHGIPVVVWLTIDLEEPEINSNGFYENLHCVVLSGYTTNTVSISDSMTGECLTVNRALFEKNWKVMGSRAMIAY